MSLNRLANATVLSEEIENQLKQMLRVDLEHLKLKVAEPITREHYIKKEAWIAFSDSVKGSEFVWINRSQIKKSDEWINVNKIEMPVRLDPASEIGICEKKQDLVYPHIKIPSETVYMPLGLAKNLGVKPESPEIVMIAKDLFYVNRGDLEYI